MKNCKRKSGYALYIVLAFVFSVGCSNYQPEHRFILDSINGTGWNRTSSMIRCDSANIISETKAIVWVGGIRMEVIADKVILRSNLRYEKGVGK